MNNLWLSVMLSLAFLLPTIACSTSPASPSPNASATPTNVLVGAEVPPYPYTTPLPPSIPTILDGIYVKLDPNPDTPTPCKRCAEYRPEGGIWAISFNKGVFSILHRDTGWRGAASFTVEGKILSLFNDPTCIEDVGIYAWKTEKELQKTFLVLEEITDACSFHQRAKNLMMIPWASCQPPDTEAAISDHWPKPPGCP